MCRVSRRYFLISCAMFSWAGCGDRPRIERIPTWSREVPDLLENSTGVESFRVSAEAEPSPSRTSVGGFAIIERGESRGKEFATRLARALVAPTAKTREDWLAFEPGVAFRCRSLERRVDVLICFKHDLVQVSLKDINDREIFRGLDCFDLARKEFVRLAKEAFPSDPIVIGLSEEPSS